MANRAIISRGTGKVFKEEGTERIHKLKKDFVVALLLNTYAIMV